MDILAITMAAKLRQRNALCAAQTSGQAISDTRRPADRTPTRSATSPQDKPDNRDRLITHAPEQQHDHGQPEPTKK